MVGRYVTIKPNPKPATRKKVRRWKTPRCTFGKGRCKRKAEVAIGTVEGLPGGEGVTLDVIAPRLVFCRSHARQEQDRMWSEEVRAKGDCELSRYHCDRFPCGGVLQAAHGFSRRYLGTRHNPLNGFCICAASHRYWGMRPLEWDNILRAEWGETVYEELRRLALSA